MINRWLKGVAIGALMCVGAVAAQAADLPTRKEAPAPVFVPPPFTWTGFYLGLNAGGIFSSGSRHVTIVDPNAGLDGGFSTATSRADLEVARPDLSAAARPATTGRPAPSCSASKPTSTGRPSARRLQLTRRDVLQPLSAEATS